MEKFINIKSNKYEIPAIISYEENEQLPAIVMCHGTGSHKDEVGDLYKNLASKLLEVGIASIRMDYAGRGDSKALGKDLTYLGEVDDTKKCYEYLCNTGYINKDKVGIIGFSQGARVMAGVLHDIPTLEYAVSWSGACHNGTGVFQDIFDAYYEEAKRNGYAVEPITWGPNIVYSKEWFDEIKDTRPLDYMHAYNGPILAIDGVDDEQVPCSHVIDIISNSTNKNTKAILLPNADHIYNVLKENNEASKRVIEETVDWILKVIE